MRLDWVVGGEVGGGKVPPLPRPPTSNPNDSTTHGISFHMVFCRVLNCPVFIPQKVVQKRSLAQPSNIGNCNLLIALLECPLAFKFLTNIKSARSYTYYTYT